MEPKTLSVIIPVYNEQETVRELLDMVLAAPLSCAKQIVVVNDGSTDASPEIIRAWIAANGLEDHAIFIDKPNGGKGSAVRAGIERSTGDVVIIQDADLEYDPRDYQQCVDPILKGECKVVYGSRELSNRNRIHSAPSFYLGGLAVTYWINLLFGSDLTDEPTCYKTFDGPLIRKLLFQGDKFEWEPEITAKLLRLGYQIKEVTVSYHPRGVEEGKKISWKDGVSALWQSTLWRFRSIAAERAKLQSWDRERPALLGLRKERLCLLLVVAAAFLARLLVALPGMPDPEKTFFRPDSPTYVEPARALLQDGRYNQAPGDPRPAVLRVPGYPAYLAALLAVSGGSLRFCVLFSCLLGALVCIPVFHAAKLMAGWKAGLVAAMLFGFNITAIAISPLFLSDTLFVFLVAFQLYFFLRFHRKRIFFYLFISVAIAALATLVRPINQLWIFPCLFLVFILDAVTWRRKLIACAGCALVFAAVLSPWLLRNHVIGAGWRLDAIGGELLFHNGAVLLGKVNHSSPELERQKLMREVDNEFARAPVLYQIEASRTDYKAVRLFALVKRHPFAYATLTIRPSILLPDAPSFLEDLKITRGGRGTFDVLNRHGLLAAVNHYFDGKQWVLLALAPLLLIVALGYLFGAAQTLAYLLRGQWFMLFVFLAFFEYYLFMPGPISMPRYQLPALLLLDVFAAVGMLRFSAWCMKFRRPVATD